MPPETVLVVDDTDDLRTLTGEILRLAGFEVTEARNGAEALTRATERPDLIVLDVHMPDMDGFEVCRRLKESSETATIPVLYLSAAYREERHRIRGLETGAAAYLTRPLDPADLVSTVRALMRLRRAQGEVATIRRPPREVAADRFGPRRGRARHGRHNDARLVRRNGSPFARCDR